MAYPARNPLSKGYKKEIDPDLIDAGPVFHLPKIIKTKTREDILADMEKERAQEKAKKAKREAKVTERKTTVKSQQLAAENKEEIYRLIQIRDRIDRITQQPHERHLNKEPNESKETKESREWIAKVDAHIDNADSIELLEQLYNLLGDRAHSEDQRLVSNPDEAIRLHEKINDKISWLNKRKIPRVNYERKIIHPMKMKREKQRLQDVADLESRMNNGIHTKAAFQKMVYRHRHLNKDYTQLARKIRNSRSYY
jgi:hypothetical protein